MQEIGFVAKKYIKFAEENGYIPTIFNPYNCKDLAGGVAPTVTTQCGSTTSSATILIIEKKGGSNMQEENQKPGIIVMGTLDNGGTTQEHNNRVHDIDGISPTLTAVAGGTHHIKIFDPTKYRVRKLTPTEYGRLQAFPVDDGWEQVVSDSQAYKQFGNAVTTTVVTAIGNSIKAFLDRHLLKDEPEEVTDLSDAPAEIKKQIIENAELLEERDEQTEGPGPEAVPKENRLATFSNDELLAELNRRMAANQ